MKGRLWVVSVIVFAACNAPASEPAVGGSEPIFNEAAPPSFPQVIELGGPVLAHPRVYPIFFAHDSLNGDTISDAKLVDFLGQLSSSSYWSTVVGEYGVGELTIAPSIVTSEFPPVDDVALQSWLASHLDGTHADWPATLGSNEIFAVFLPSNVTFAYDGAISCLDYGAYHNEATSALGQQFAYALVPRCPLDNNATFDYLTEATSHELVEAATDPYIYTAPAFSDLSASNYVWAYTPGVELGDMCAYEPTAGQRIVGPYVVQRIWSNAAVAAGHDPCVPAAESASTPYIAAAPATPDVIMLTDLVTYASVTTAGLDVPQGATKTTTVTLFSDAPSADWTVTAWDNESYFGGTPVLSFAWDSTTGHNGDTLHLTITRVNEPPAGIPTELVIEAMRDGAYVSQWWALVGDGINAPRSAVPVHAQPRELFPVARRSSPR